MYKVSSGEGELRIRLGGKGRGEDVPYALKPRTRTAKRACKARIGRVMSIIVVRVPPCAALSAFGLTATFVSLCFVGCGFSGMRCRRNGAEIICVCCRLSDPRSQLKPQKFVLRWTMWEVTSSKGKTSLVPPLSHPRREAFLTTPKAGRYAPFLIQPPPHQTGSGEAHALRHAPLQSAQKPVSDTVQLLAT